MELTYQVLGTRLKSEPMSIGDHYALLPFWSNDGGRHAYVPTFRTKKEAVAFIHEEGSASIGQYTILEVYQKHPYYTQ